MKTYLNATEDSGKKFYMDFNTQGKVVMLNLLKFNEHADYSEFESLKPKDPISGKEAYKRYMDSTLPHLSKAGSRIVFYGRSDAFLIGPENESWDAVLLVEHESVEKFMAFAQHKEYLKTAGHRSAALQDSRLLPMSEFSKQTLS